MSVFVFDGSTIAYFSLLCGLVPRKGFEPSTYGLKGRCAAICATGAYETDMRTNGFYCPVGAEDHPVPVGFHHYILLAYLLVLPAGFEPTFPP